MKRKILKLLKLSFISALLSGCNVDLNINSSNSAFISSEIGNYFSSEEIKSTISDVEIESSEIKNSEFSSVEELPRIIEIYASNDIHGRISENESEDEPGIAKLATYLKNRKKENEEGFVYINSGDYWQDTYESGYNKGKLLTECLDLMECETMTLGNHEFDWGIDIIKDNKELTNTSFLGANIYQYPETFDKVDFADDYKIIERNGLKIGIIGAIGENQLTSITSSIWEGITFLPHTPIVKALSDELRVEKDCDIVILSIHADEDSADGYELTKVSPLSNKRYVDAVFCAHTHQSEIKYYNGVPFVQGADHGTQLSYVKMKYLNGDVTIESVSSSKGLKQMNQLAADEEISALVNEYFDEEYLNKKNKVHGTVTDYSYISSKIAGNMLAKATYEELQDNGIEVDIVINNGARQSVDAGTMTSEKIFNMIPFTNKTLVTTNIKGEDIINECVNYSNPYYMPNANLEIEASSYYTVACIDYVLLHKNTNRQYNYFKSFNKNNVIYTIDDYCNVIVENYLQKHQTVSGYDFNTINFSCLG